MNYGVGIAEVGFAYPDIEVSASSSITEAGLAFLVSLAAAELNGILERVGIDVDAISDGTTLYSNCQRLTLDLLGPRLQAAAHGQVATAGELADIREVVSAQLVELKKRPQDLGDVAEDVEPRLRTSTDLLGLKTDDASRRDRRFFDSSKSRTSGPDDIWRN